MYNILYILTVGQNHNCFPEISLLGGTYSTEEASQGSFCVTVFLHPTPFLSPNVFSQLSFHMKGHGIRAQSPVTASENKQESFELIQ